MSEEIKLSEELQKCLIDIVKSCEYEDKDIRKAMIRQWKKNEEFWHGVQYLFWSGKDESWKSPADFGWNEGEDMEDVGEQLGSFSDKVIDIFKGHGESIIAALSAQIPSLRFIPDDADNTNDLMTARTYSRIADLVQRHNRAKMVFFRALFFLAIQGLVASFRYKDSDAKYGVYKVPVYDKKTIEGEKYICTDCDYESETDWQQESPACPQCGSIEPPKKEKTKEEVPTQVKEEEYPKSRAKIDIFGPLHFKVPFYARNQDECTYFILYGDLGKDAVKYTYQDFAEEIEEEHLENLDRFSRSAYTIQDPEEGQKHLVLVKKCWLRPAAFFRLTKKDKIDQLLKKFPDGCRVTLIGKKDIFVSVLAEKLDDRWQIGQAGLSTYIHSDPVLRPLVQIQEMRNQLVNLIVETIEHGIPSEYADPDTINFDTYGRFEAVPGYIYKAKPRRPGDSLANSFYTSSKSSLSKEVILFIKQLDQDAQFSVGSFPSIYGGASEGKSRTFAEYSMSRQMALQRLSILWNFVVEWWTKTLHGCVELYKECVIEDERFVKYEDGNYINVWIKQSEMQGKIGGVEPEASDAFPVSQTQIKDLILKLMELNNEYINSVLYNPANAKVIQDCFAVTDLKIPGEAQRIKQAGEVKELLKFSPVSEIQSTVPIDIDVDDHAIHIAELTEFLVDQVGLDVKENNPEGYANCKAHLKEHQMAALQLTMQAGGGGTPSGTPPETNKGEDLE